MMLFQPQMTPLLLRVQVTLLGYHKGTRQKDSILTPYFLISCLDILRYTRITINPGDEVRLPVASPFVLNVKILYFTRDNPLTPWSLTGRSSPSRLCSACTMGSHNGYPPGLQW